MSNENSEYYNWAESVKQNGGAKKKRSRKSSKKGDVRKLSKKGSRKGSRRSHKGGARKSSKKASRKGSKRSRKQKGGDIPAHLKPFNDLKQAIIDRMLKIVGGKDELKTKYGNYFVKFSAIAKQAKFLAENDDAVKALKIINDMSDSELKSFVDKHSGKTERMTSKKRSKKSSKKGSKKGSKKSSRKGSRK